MPSLTKAPVDNASRQRIARVAEACVSLAQGQNPRPLAPDVARLSALFTDERGARQRNYMRDPALRRAYLAFWVPHNVARIAGVLGRARDEGHLPGSAPRVLDLGAGPLSGVLAAWCVWGDLKGAVAVDLSRPALESGLSVLRAVGALDGAGGTTLSMADVALVDAALDGPVQRWAPRQAVDLVILANVLNEVSDPRETGPRRRLLDAAAAATSATGRVLVVEPAMRLEARALMALRDELVGDGARVLSPCRGARTCPLLQTRGDWCHQDVRWDDRPPNYRALERAAGLPKDQLAVAHLLLATGDDVDDGPRRGLRLIGGVMRDQQGVERRYACGRDLVTVGGTPRLSPQLATAIRGAVVDDDAVGKGPAVAPLRRPAPHAPSARSDRGGGGRGPPPRGRGRPAR